MSIARADPRAFDPQTRLWRTDDGYHDPSISMTPMRGGCVCSIHLLLCTPLCAPCVANPTWTPCVPPSTRDEDDLARIIACAPGAHPVMHAIAALCGGLPSLLDPDTIADPAFHDALRLMIGTGVGYEALQRLAEVAPAGWGAAHADALITAVNAAMVDAGVAAALIGPGDERDGLLHAAWGIASAIRRWGRATPAVPTAWATALAPAERDRLIVTVRRDPFSVAS